MPAARAQAPGPPPRSATPAPAIQPDFADPLLRMSRRRCPPPRGGTGEHWEPAFLKSLPQPPDQPRSLVPGPAPIGPPPPDLEKPYFQWDPILDPPQLGQQPGWFTNVQIGVIHPHIFFGQMSHSCSTSPGQRVLVAPGAAGQSWTVAPRLEIGYRLPSGFGGFSFSDRFFSTSGVRTVRRAGRLDDTDDPARRQLLGLGLHQPRVYSLGKLGNGSGAPASDWPKPGSIVRSVQALAGRRGHTASSRRGQQLHGRGRPALRARAGSHVSRVGAHVRHQARHRQHVHARTAALLRDGHSIPPVGRSAAPLPRISGSRFRF